MAQVFLPLWRSRGCLLGDLLGADEGVDARVSSPCSDHPVYLARMKASMVKIAFSDLLCLLGAGSLAILYFGSFSVNNGKAKWDNGAHMARVVLISILSFLYT